jgi:hypothetical protein
MKSICFVDAGSLSLMFNLKKVQNGNEMIRMEQLIFFFDPKRISAVNVLLNLPVFYR